MKVRILENPKNNTGFSIFFPYNQQHVDQLKLCLAPMWDPKLKCWLTDGPEVLLDMQRFDIQVEWISPGARKIAEKFRQSLWDTMDCRLIDLEAEEYNYQKQGADFLSAMNRAILADDMGTGKSKQALDASARIGSESTLVLCNKTLTYNWLNECWKWHPDIEAGVIPLHQKDREKFWEKPPTICIANYEQLSNRYWPKEMDWQVAILDEASRFKNASTIIFKNVTRILKYCEYGWALTGTPLEKNLTEMYYLFAAMRPSVLGFYPRFKEQHLMVDRWGSKVSGVRNLTLLQERIAPFILRRTKAEVLPQLPPKQYQTRFVRLSPEEQKAYSMMTSKFKNTLKEWGVSGEDHPMTQVLRMRQFCATPDLFTKDLGKGAKFEELQEIINEWNGQILIFCFFEEVTERLQKWLGTNPEAYISGKVKSDKERFRRCQEFNKGNLGKVFISTDAGNQGLNITGANLIIHYDQIFNAQKMNQREDRLHRIGQTDNVTVMHLMCVDTVDYGTYLVNREEEELFKQVVEGAEELLLRKLDAPRLAKLVEGRLEAA